MIDEESFTGDDSLRRFLTALPGATEGFPFDEHTLVLKVGGKMFAMTGLEEDPPRLTLKGDPDDNEALRAAYSAVQPGHYMNKRHWNTITLDGTVPEDLLKEMILNSYSLVVRGLPREIRNALEIKS